MTTETFFANFGHLADAPNGVQKLRELILQLAVQGKLVPQDPNDEPASVLVEKLCFKPITQDTAFDVPSNWVWLRFSDAFDIKGGSQPPKNQFIDKPKKSYVRLLQIRDFGSKPVPVFVPEDSVSKLCAADDIMMGRYGASVGKVFTGQAGAYNVALVKFIFSRDLFYNLFVFNFLKSSYFQKHLVNFSRSAQAGFNKGDLAKINIPLPPLAEQKRIVAKVDQLMTLCDELETRQKKQHQTRVRLNNAAIDALLTAREPEEFAAHWQRISTNFDLLYDHPETIGKLRAAILQLAVQGKLVPQNPNDEPASVLLERIRAEKERLVREGEMKKAKALEPVSANEVPFDFPDGWDVERFGNLTSTVGGVTKGRKLSGRKTAAYPYLRVANVQRWFVDLHVIKEIEIPVDELDKYKLLRGDLLITEGGDWDKVGRTAIWEGQIENCLHQNHVFRSRLFVEDICRDWLVLTLNSSVGRKYFAESSKQTTNLASINMTQLKHFPMPVPPVEEQKRIVAKVDQLMTLCDELEVQLNQALQHCGKLMEATVRQLLVA